MEGKCCIFAVIFMETTPATRSINLHGELYDLTTPRVMGIVNVTPDSFFAGSRTPAADALRERVEKMFLEGVDMIDIGGYSTRPGAAPVSEKEELERLALGLRIVRDINPEAIVSVDTFRANVARCCIEELGADIINDISGGDMDTEMFATVSQLQVPYIIMHTRGTPATMQTLSDYTDVGAEVLSSLAAKVSILRRMGLNDIIVDPGFGFAKTAAQNYELLRALPSFRAIGCPVLVGLSRKSMVYRSLGISPADALPGTTALHTYALMHGADILRVHDVAEAKQVIEVCKMIGL